MPQKQETAPITAPSAPRRPRDASHSWLSRLREAAIFNCFWFILPILLWNLLVTLPGQYASPIFWRDIPPLVTYGENLARMLVILFPLAMASHIRRGSQRVGLLLYSVGLVGYCASWLALILLPTSSWSTSLIGFLAPTYTPLVWAAGIGLIGDRLHWRSRYRPWIYMVMALAFTIFHVSHATIVFMRGA
jgi:hypothetical protein